MTQNNMKSTQILLGMQGFIEKVLSNKGKFLLGLGGLALVSMFGYMYKQYINEDEQQKRVDEKQLLNEQLNLGAFDLQEQLAKFKLTMQVLSNPPTFEQVKRMLSFSFQVARKQLQRIDDQFKKVRRQLNYKQSLQEYFKTVIVNMVRMRQIASTLQKAIMIDIGINTDMITLFQTEIAQFLQQQQSVGIMGDQQVTLGEIKQALQNQVTFLQGNGNGLVDDIVQNCKDWKIQAKDYIPEVFSTYLTDSMFKEYPQLDKYNLRLAEIKFQMYLVNQTTRIKQQIHPLIARLIKEIGINGGSKTNNYIANEQGQTDVIDVKEELDEGQNNKKVQQKNEKDVQI